MGVPTFVKLTSADSASSGLDVRALWSLLQEFSQNGRRARVLCAAASKCRPACRRTSWRLKAQAIRDCDTCHRQGAASFQSVTVSLAGPDGRPMRRDASKGILTSVESIGSIGGFYAIGSNRIKLLDVLLLMALGAGIVVPWAT